MAKSLIDGLSADEWQVIWKEAKAKGMKKKKPKGKSKPLIDVLNDDLNDLSWDDGLDDGESFDDEGTVKPKKPRVVKPKPGQRDAVTLAILKKMGYKVK
jgi:hypothetical protein